MSTKANPNAIAKAIANLKAKAKGFEIAKVDIETTQAIVQMWKKDKIRLTKELPEEQRKEYEKMGDLTPMATSITMGEAASAALLLYVMVVLLKHNLFSRAIQAEFIQGGNRRYALNPEQLEQAQGFLRRSGLEYADFEAYINGLDIPDRNREAILGVGWETFVPDLLQFIFLATAAFGFVTYPLNNSVPLRF